MQAAAKTTTISATKPVTITAAVLVVELVVGLWFARGEIFPVRGDGYQGGLYMSINLADLSMEVLHRKMKVGFRCGWISLLYTEPRNAATRRRSGAVAQRRDDTMIKCGRACVYECRGTWECWFLVEEEDCGVLMLQVCEMF